MTLVCIVASCVTVYDEERFSNSKGQFIVSHTPIETRESEKEQIFSQNFK